SMYTLILAGGGGTRLWPLSTPERPKPFLPLLGDRSLLQLTADRLVGLVAPRDVYVVTDRRYGALVRAQLPAATVLEEPLGRNTAAAVALAVVGIDRADDDVLAVLPADHAIGDAAVYRHVIGVAEALSRGACGVADPLVTLGIRPTFPATGYGYLRPDLAAAQAVEGLHAYRLGAFIEKPRREEAEALLAHPGVAWNAGIFVARRRALRAAFAAHAPAILGLIEQGLAEGRLEGAYGAIAAASVDRAVMEAAAAAGQVVMVGMPVPWSDLGSWAALLDALGAPGIEGTVVEAGGRAQAGPRDLVVRRLAGRLVLGSGPGTIDGEAGPSALLVGAAGRRDVVEALLDRVAAGES
ncbi:MAG: sugar phosphate nucleotidyltransferase, partial [Candidatus Limnocylindrales bacterium]